MTSGTRTRACEHGDAYCRLQKTIGIVSRLFFTMKIPTTTCGDPNAVVAHSCRLTAIDAVPSTSSLPGLIRQSIPERSAFSDGCAGHKRVYARLPTRYARA
jgi:hypothetical protein